MGCTNATSLTAAAGFLNASTTVFSNPSVTTALGANTYTLTTPYRWDGVSNLIIEVCFDNTAFTQYDQVNYTTTAYTSVLYRRVDGSTGCTLTAPTAATSRPDVILRNCAIVPPVAGVTYAWTVSPAASGSVNNAAAQNPIATVTGAQGSIVRYIVQGSDGTCTSRDTVIVNVNCNLLCNVTAAINATTGTELTCTTPTRQLNASGPSTGNGALSYGWAGPGIVGSTTSGVINVNVAGVYTVTVTNTTATTFCTSTATVTITNNNTIAPVSLVSDIAVLSCADATATLTASPNAPGSSQYNYAWSPANNGYTIQVIAPGIYTVTVTNTDNGCSGTGTVSITQNNNVPTATITPPQQLTCTTTSITLDASASSPAGVDFLWSTNTGMPYQLIDIQPTRAVTATGTYTVTVTNSTNGCTRTASVTVSNNITPPVFTLSANRTTLTCANPTANLTATNNASYLYAWSPVQSSATKTAVVNAFGTYTVTVTNNANGCTLTATITILLDQTPPVVTATAPQVLTCALTSTSVTASGATTYVWSNAANTATTSLSAIGTYTVTGTASSNGCTNTATVVVTNDLTPPTVTVTAPTTILNCTTLNILLTGTGGGTYNWSNGGGTNATFSVSAAGTYTVTVTSATTGCTATGTIVITQNITQPTVAITAPQVLTCTLLNTNVTASGGNTYVWSNGPNTAISNLAAIGTYTVTATTTANGCTATRTVTVTNDLSVPTPTITSPTTVLTCATTSITLTGNGGGSYVWSTAGAPTTTTISVTTPNTYTVTATKTSNGCTATATRVITQDIVPPTPAITGTAANNTLTCAVLSSDLTVTGGNTYVWSTTGAPTTPTITVTTPATYTVTATTTANGCTAIANIIILQNLSTPAPTIAAPSQITCTAASSILTASGGATYIWSTAGAPTTASITVTAAGSYTVTATLAATGCTAIVSTTVTSDLTQPNPAIVSSPTSELSCTNPTLILTPSGADSYDWGTSIVAVNGVASVSAFSRNCMVTAPSGLVR